MIPTIIHYCWFGGRPLPRRVHQCVSSWRRQCPDYRYLLWTEENLELSGHPFAEWCLAQKKYSFLSDYIRLYLVYRYGGLYFNADCELLRPPEELLHYGAFFAFQRANRLATGLGFGAEAQHPAVKAMLRQYEQLTPQENGAYPLLSAAQLNTAALLPLGLRTDGTRQHIADAELLPKEWFDPYDAGTGRLRMTPKTVSIRWYAKEQQTGLCSRLARSFQRVFGTNG